MKFAECYEALKECQHPTNKLIENPEEHLDVTSQAFLDDLWALYQKGVIGDVSFSKFAGRGFAEHEKVMNSKIFGKKGIKKVPELKNFVDDVCKIYGVQPVQKLGFASRKNDIMAATFYSSAKMILYVNPTPLKRTQAYLGYDFPLVVNNTFHEMRHHYQHALAIKAINAIETGGKLSPEEGFFGTMMLIDTLLSVGERLPKDFMFYYFSATELDARIESAKKVYEIYHAPNLNPKLKREFLYYILDNTNGIVPVTFYPHYCNQCRNGIVAETQNNIHLEKQLILDWLKEEENPKLKKTFSNFIEEYVNDQSIAKFTSSVNEEFYDMVGHYQKNVRKECNNKQNRAIKRLKIEHALQDVPSKIRNIRPIAQDKIGNLRSNDAERIK